MKTSIIKVKYLLFPKTLNGVRKKGWVTIEQTGQSGKWKDYAFIEYTTIYLPSGSNIPDKSFNTYRQAEKYVQSFFCSVCKKEYKKGLSTMCDAEWSIDSKIVMNKNK